MSVRNRSRAGATGQTECSKRRLSAGIFWCVRVVLGSLRGPGLDETSGPVFKRGLVSWIFKMASCHTSCRHLESVAALLGGICRGSHLA